MTLIVLFLAQCDRVEVRLRGPGPRLAFTEAHGVDIPESKEVTHPDISLPQRPATAGSHDKAAWHRYSHVSTQPVNAL